MTVELANLLNHSPNAGDAKQKGTDNERSRAREEADDRELRQRRSRPPAKEHAKAHQNGRVNDVDHVGARG